MKKVGEYWLPDDDTYFGPIIEETGGFHLDRLEAALAVVRSWNVAVDVGAHVGTWTRVLKSKFDFVHAYEACQETFECLVKNVEDFQKVRCVRSAVGDQTGYINYKSVWDKSRPGNSGAKYLTPDSTTKLPCTRLDDEALKDVNFLKIDVEGMELKVLRGACKIIQSQRPVILMEVKKGMAERFNNGDDMAAHVYLLDLGYRQVNRLGGDRIYEPL